MTRQGDDPLVERQRRKATAVGIPSARRHILLCCDQTEPKCCEKERSLEAWTYLKARLKALGLSEQGGVYRTKANCLRICEGGPIAVVYPEGAWYGDRRFADRSTAVAGGRQMTGRTGVA
jgi:hypothetical protein